MSRAKRWATSTVRLLRLSAAVSIGRRPWLPALLSLGWPAALGLQVILGWRREGFGPADLQGLILGVPMTALAIGLGARLVTVDLKRRSLESVYGVPGGPQRAWMPRLAAALGLLVAVEALLAAVSQLFFTDVVLTALVGALIGACFYLAATLTLAVLLRGEIAGAMAGFSLWAGIAFTTGLEGARSRLSPFWNPLTAEVDRFEILLRTAEHRLAFLGVSALLVAAAFTRASRAETMLGGRG